MRVFSEFAPDANRGDPYLRDEQLARIRANLSDAGATIAVASAKGGVGKSVIAVNVAAALALRGNKVAIIDADLNSPSVVAMLGMKQPRGFPLTEGIEPAAGPHGLRVVSSHLLTDRETPAFSFVDPDGGDGPAQAPANPIMETRESAAFYKMLAQSRLGAVNFVIIDLAPGIEDLHAINSMAQPDGIVMVTHPSAHAVQATQQAVRMIRRAKAPVLGVIENMAGFNCDGCRSVRPLMPEGELAGVASDLELPVIGRLPFDPRLAEASDRGKLFVHEYADTPIAKSLTEIAARVEKLVEAARQRP